MSQTPETNSETPRPLPGFRLIGEDGNAFAIMGRFQKAARAARVHYDTVAAVLRDAESGDYQHLLSVFIPWSIDNAPAPDEEDDDA